MKQASIYSISKFVKDDNSINAEITFNEEHDIFKGHFPNNPIVPGVIQVQIIKDIAEKGLKKKLLLSNSKNIKFLNFINPLKDKPVLLSLNFEVLENTSIKVNSQIYSEDNVFIKFNGIFSGYAKIY